MLSDAPINIQCWGILIGFSVDFKKLNPMMISWNATIKYQISRGKMYFSPQSSTYPCTTHSTTEMAQEIHQ